MPIPVTRPFNVNQTAYAGKTLPRGPQPGLSLPPSNGVQMPQGGPVMHTVKNPAHQVPTRTRVAPARVT